MNKEAFPIQFCPECGKRIFDKEEENTHAMCIQWGIMKNKYRRRAEWIQACIENGKRITEIMKL